MLLINSVVQKWTDRNQILASVTSLSAASQIAPDGLNTV